MHLSREIFIISGGSQRRWGEVLKLLGKTNIYLLLAQALYYSVLQIVPVLYSMPLRAQNTWEARGVLTFKAMFHQREAAQGWVVAKGRFVSRQLSVCLAAGLP